MSRPANRNTTGDPELDRIAVALAARGLVTIEQRELEELERRVPVEKLGEVLRAIVREEVLGAFREVFGSDEVKRA